MSPTDNMVFVQEIKKIREADKSAFLENQEYTAYEVEAVGKEVSSCKKGDFILFTQRQEFAVDTKIIAVSENDIVGVQTNA